MGWNLVLERQGPLAKWKNAGTVARDYMVRFARSSPLGAASGVFLILVVVVAIFARQIAPSDPLKGDYLSIRQAPLAGSYLGTDDLGRDVLSRLIHGTRISLMIGFTAVLLGDVFGLIWGVASGYVGRTFDLLSQRGLDVLMSFPGLILALLLMVALGAGLNTVIIAIAVTRVPAATRMIRATAMTTKEMTFVDAARAIGQGDLEFIHIDFVE